MVRNRAKRDILKTKNFGILVIKKGDMTNFLNILMMSKINSIDCNSEYTIIRTEPLLGETNITHNHVFPYSKIVIHRSIKFGSDTRIYTTMLGTKIEGCRLLFCQRRVLTGANSYYLLV